MANLTPTSFSRLAEIAQATQQGGSCYSLNDTVLNDLIAQSLVVVNPQLVQRDNLNGTVVSIAARATDAGVAAYLAGPAAAMAGVSRVAADWGVPPAPEAAPEATGSPEKPAFVIESYDELPEVSRTRQGGGLRPREETFPWSEVSPGQRFFIPEVLSQTGKSAGQPVRHYSAAASANERMRERGIPKHFIVVVVKTGDIMFKDTAKEHVVVANGEYVYCRDGFAPPPKPRAKKTDEAAS